MHFWKLVWISVRILAAAWLTAMIFTGADARIVCSILASAIVLGAVAVAAVMWQSLGKKAPTMIVRGGHRHDVN